MCCMTSTRAASPFCTPCVRILDAIGSIDAKGDRSRLDPGGCAGDGVAVRAVTYRQTDDPRIDLARCGATPEEQTFLFTGERRRNSSTGKGYWPGQRVELNAMTSDQFVAWIERRLTEHGVTKVIPTAETLAKAYRFARRTKAMNDELARIQEQMKEGTIEIPDDLQDHVRALLDGHPELSWDAAVWQIVQGYEDVAS